MAFYQLRKEQLIRASVDELWEFISSPANLQKITPEYMKFEITSSDTHPEMYPGMIITYKVSPLPGMRMKWVTEITQVNEKHFFIDEQRVGPYKIWHHQHHLIPTEDGVKMIDIISYVPPFGFLGAIANSLFIKRQLNGIFEHRRKVLEQLYPLGN